MRGPEKMRAPRNQTITLNDQERASLTRRLLHLTKAVTLPEIENRTIQQDLLTVLPFLPRGVVDLVILDPPYNLSKTFGSNRFKQLSTDQYLHWMETWLAPLLSVLKPTASLYICGDWRSSAAIQLFAEKRLCLQNRITWEREKGRGAKSNWKNCSEDIWFCTLSSQYYFDPESVKLKKRVIAPYKENGVPKDWEATELGGFRLTSPSNLWTDISIPFWSMPENTDHPTQKPEKLLAKLILASSKEGDLILDPFLGSGTTSVVAKKLGRRFIGIELDPEFALLAEKRLQLADQDRAIQGYVDGLFWERNSLAFQPKTA